MKTQSAAPKNRSVRAKMTWEDRLRLQLESGCSQGSIAKFLAGEPLRGATLKRLQKACAELGLEVIA